MKKKKQLRKMIFVLDICLLIVALFILIMALWRRPRSEKKQPEKKTEAEAAAVSDGKTETDSPEQADDNTPAEQERLARQQEMLEEAAYLEATYDYEKAISVLQSIEDSEGDSEIQERIAKCRAAYEACVPVNMEEVTHIFYHTLVVDPVRCFANQDSNPQAVGNNQWMTTVEEFKKITQEMYDRGYVLVSMHDLYKESTDENGRTVYVPAEILLPPGKKAFVLSQDDLCYYHSYDNYGYPAKLVLDENGKVTNEYIDADGNVLTGAYDVVPLLDQFVEEHPDASYRGAKGTIALTGYNGILGYRTDISYTQLDSDLSIDKRQWISNHPEFSLDEERAKAKEIADVMKANGWEFASHTWGHLRIADASLGRIQTDNQRWKENVEPLTGPTDTIIFAHGQDLSAWGDYNMGDPKLQYLLEQGYRIFCNVDSNVYRLWFGPGYLRMGRRNLDGYRLYYNAIGEQNNVSDLIDAKSIIDPLRPPVKHLN